ncbi:MAG: hypothetical protein RMA76_12785 [Deltaproteobacteria bacterium]|jgi:hypothetical protein
MKSIRDFVEGKVRRAEIGDAVRLVALDAAHATFGAPEIRVESDVGAAAFYAEGFVIGDDAVAYADIERIREEGTTIDIAVPDRILRIHASDAGARVVFDTLRWIGRAKLRRRLD